jgi:hypothetical protein
VLVRVSEAAGERASAIAGSFQSAVLPETLLTLCGLACAKILRLLMKAVA